MIPFIQRFVGGKWRWHIEDEWTINALKIRVICDLPDGSYVTPISWGSEEVPCLTLKTVTADERQGMQLELVPLLLEEDAAKELMVALQKHFGAYAGVDYERLRKDYDRVAAQAQKAQDFIQDTLKTIIEGRKPKTGDGS